MWHVGLLAAALAAAPTYSTWLHHHVVSLSQQILSMVNIYTRLCHPELLLNRDLSLCRPLARFVSVFADLATVYIDYLITTLPDVAVNNKFRCFLFKHFNILHHFKFQTLIILTAPL